MAKNVKKKSKKLLIATIIFIIGGLFAISGFIIMYGPFDYIRNLYVTTAMNTMEHQWMAKIFYNDDKIKSIMQNNYFIALTDEVKTDDIIINTKEKQKYKNEYEKELLTREPGNDLYKVLNFKIGI